MDTTEKTVGLVGVGLVGAVLARRMTTAGYAVVGYDTDGARLSALLEAGGRVASSAADVASRAPVVVLSLFDSDSVREVVEGERGILSASVAPTHVIDTTTGSPAETEALAGRLASRGVHLIDATISGSSAQLRDGSAVLMVGGDPQAVAACDSLLRTLSPNVRHVGPPGSGAKAKLATNVLIGLNRAALAEALAFAESVGLDLAAFLELARVTPGYSAAMDSKGDRMTRGDYTPDSRVRQHRKDVRLILEAAESSGQGMPLSTTHAGLLDALIEAGDGDLDNAAIIRALRRLRD
jgi:3-hydroxyisobutyrate dehydrogenase-like beta-hydroxyacid dehydrogenase